MVRSLSRVAYPFVAALFVGCTVVQVFLAGLGVFEGPAAFITHREFGYLFGWLTIVLLILALAGRLPRRITGLSVLLLVLFALQSVFVAVRVDAPAVAALHPVNGFAILGVAAVATRAGWIARRESVPVTGDPAEPKHVAAHSEAA